MLNSNTSSTCADNMVNLGLLAADIFIVIAWLCPLTTMLSVFTAQTTVCADVRKAVKVF